jgi:hypothetical protein
VTSLPSGVRNGLTEIAVAAVLVAIPTAGVGVPAHATTGFGRAANAPAQYGMQPGQPPAAPSTDAPVPPPPPPPPIQPPVGGYAGDWPGLVDTGAGGGA